MLLFLQVLNRCVEKMNWEIHNWVYPLNRYGFRGGGILQAKYSNKKMAIHEKPHYF